MAQVCTGQPRAAIVTVTGLVSVPPPFHLSVLSGGTQGAPVGVGVEVGGSVLAMTLVADEQWGGGGGVSSVSKKAFERLEPVRLE